MGCISFSIERLRVGVAIATVVETGRCGCGRGGDHEFAAFSLISNPKATNRGAHISDEWWGPRGSLCRRAFYFLVLFLFCAWPGVRTA
nr:hypothetical protein Itr_chr04CG07790 [Ipomoea trifida]